MRAIIRREFAKLLGADDALESSQSVIAHFSQNFANQSPVVIVASAGSDRSKLTPRSGKAEAFIDVFVFVLRGLDDTYTDADADAIVDILDEELASVIFGNQKTEFWQAIRYVRRSNIEPVQIAGLQYWLEVHPLVFDVY